MSVKFKIGFEIDAETLFGIVAKFIPLDNLTVEEVIERPQHAPRLASPERIAKSHHFMDGHKMVGVRAAQKNKRAQAPAGFPVNLEDGVNGVIMGVLADGQPHRFKEFGKASAAKGYARTGMGSRLKQLLEYGVIVRTGVGEYVKGKTEPEARR